MQVVFDIGGTNMRVAAVKHGNIGSVLRLPTPQNGPEAIAQLCAMASDAAAGAAITLIVGGCPGVIGKDGRLNYANNLLDWNGIDIAGEIKRRLSADSQVENDAAIAGLGEAIFGAGRGKSIVAYMCIGTGVGGARIVDGRIDIRASGFEPGAQILQPNMELTLEQMVSGTAILQTFKVEPKKLTRDRYVILTRWLAAGVHNAVMFWSPDVVVLGGSLVLGENGYRAADISAELKRINMLSASVEIKAAELGDNAGLYGALALIEQAVE